VFLRWRVAIIAAVIAVGLACGAESPAAPSPALLTATIGACTYTLDPSGLPATIPTSGGTYSVKLTTDRECVWSVQFPFSPFPFIESAPVAPSTGSGTIVITIHPHTGTLDRKVDLSIASLTLGRVQSAATMPPAGPNAILAYSGTAGETLSYGQAGVATTDQYKVTSLEFGALPVYLTLDTLAPSRPWPRQFTITMQAANRTMLSAGVYTDLARWLGLNGSSNTAAVAISSTGCDVASNSSFEIFGIARNGDGTLQRVHYKMLYRCATAPPTSLLTLEGWYPNKGTF
jgi:hypothetical protein